MEQDWGKIVENSKAEIEALEIQREDIDRRIARLKKVILAAEPMIPDLAGLGGGWLRLEVEAAGITDACRKVLEASGKWMSPLAVRDALEVNGMDLSRQKNAMASIHAVLKRLKDKNELRAMMGSDGGTVYQWKRKRTLHFTRRHSFLGAATNSIANTSNETLAAMAAANILVSGGK